MSEYRRSPPFLISIVVQFYIRLGDPGRLRAVNTFSFYAAGASPGPPIASRRSVCFLTGGLSIQHRNLRFFFSDKRHELTIRQRMSYRL